MVKENKKCIECHKTKPRDLFYKDLRMTDKLKSSCKKCSNNRYYAWVKKKKLENPFKRKHPGKFGSKEYQRSVRLLHTFGITIENYNSIFTEQEGCCYICRKPQIELNKPLSIDHCHKTGKIRGLLCNLCNTSIGGFRNNVVSLENAINYLKIHQPSFSTTIEKLIPF